MYARGRAHDDSCDVDFGVITRDITPEGIGITAEFGPSPGDVLELKIDLEGQIIECQGKVSWIKKQTNHNNKDRFICGIKITHIPYNYWSDLLKFYSRHVFKDFSFHDFLTNNTDFQH